MADDTKPTLTLDDLYGESDSNSQPVPEESLQDQTSPAEAAAKEHLDPKHLVYEETPVITPQPEPEVAAAPSPVVFESRTPEKNDPAGRGHGKPKRGGRVVRGLLLFLVMMAVGMGVSVLYRNFVIRLTGEDAEYTGSRSPQTSGLREIISDEPLLVVAETTPEPSPAAAGDGTPEPTPVVPPELIVAPQPAATTWQTLSLVRGAGRTQVPGISYALPPEILAPVCDGTGCPSVGSYLPGGTRLTLAYYPRNILTPDFERTIVTDAAGRKFTTTVAEVAGIPALSFDGSFTGTTTGGYRFTRMRGFMIAVDNQGTLEINHFAPAGIEADFESDEALFMKIVSALSFNR